MPPIAHLCACALLLIAGQAFAQSGSISTLDSGGDAGIGADDAGPARNPAFYSYEIAVNSEGDGERRAAMARALGQVVIRLTGDFQAPSNNVIRRASANVDGLATSFSFRQSSERVNGVPVYKTLLTVKFDPESLDALISAAGLKYWPSDRQKPLLWLAIDDGRGPRLVTSKQLTVVKPLASRGLEVGMRYLLPAGTSTELASVGSIWSMNAAAMQVLTGRYRNDMQLLGKVYRQPPGWAADWLLTQAGVELARWSFAGNDPQKVIASGVDEGASAIAKRDAKALDTGVAGPQLVDVFGVNSQSDFIRLMSYLQSMAVVRKLTVLKASPEKLSLQLDLVIGMKGFAAMVDTGETLNLVSEGGSGSVARFNLR